MATSPLSAEQAPDPDAAQLAALHNVTHAKHALIEKATENLDRKNRTTVEELYDAVMAVNHVVNIPDGVKKTIKGPLVDAEAAYWSKTKPGIHEDAIVEAYNNLVTALALPDEAKMTLGQFQLIRHGLFVNFNPKFMGEDVHFIDDVTSEAKTNPPVSPLQTIHIVMSVIDSKLLDIYGRWLVTPEEWKRMDKSHFADGPPPGAKVTFKSSYSYSYGYGGSDRSQRVQIKFHQAMSKMTDLEGLTMLQNALSTLGVI